jgi:hypothetical protein
MRYFIFGFLAATVSALILFGCEPETKKSDCTSRIRYLKRGVKTHMCHPLILLNDSVHGLDNSFVWESMILSYENLPVNITYRKILDTRIRTANCTMADSFLSKVSGYYIIIESLSSCEDDIK